MNFDGAFSRSGKGVGIFIESPFGQEFKFAYRLEFNATNNVVEYEALLLGLEFCKDMGVKCLNIKGDSDVVIQQLKNKFACKYKRLKRYKNAVWDTMESFDVLNLIVVPRDQNFKVDELDLVASTLQLSQDLIKENITIKVIFMPLVPDNMDHWKIFDDYKQFIKLLNHMQEFFEFHNNEKEEQCNYIEYDHKINPILRGLVSQEKLFEKQDGHKQRRKHV
jgi:ribonuclease HI